MGMEDVQAMMLMDAFQLSTFCEIKIIDLFLNALFEDAFMETCYCRKKKYQVGCPAVKLQGQNCRRLF